MDTSTQKFHDELTETFHKYFTTEDGSEMLPLPSAEECAQMGAESAAAAAQRDYELWQYEQHQIDQQER